MSPLQRHVLRILCENEQGLGIHEIANRISQKTGKQIYHLSIGGAFSHKRKWLHSDTGRINERSIITISPEGRAALDAEDAHREATHPMGPIKPGRFFVFVEEVHVIKRHTMIVTNVANAEEAEAVAREQCDRGEYPATMSISIDRNFAVRPVRQGHGA